MNRKLQRLCSMLLCAAMLLGFLPGTVHAEEMEAPAAELVEEVSEVAEQTASVPEEQPSAEPENLPEEVTEIPEETEAPEEPAEEIPEEPDEEAVEQLPEEPTEETEVSDEETEVIPEETEEPEDAEEAPEESEEEPTEAEETAEEAEKTAEEAEEEMPDLFEDEEVYSAEVQDILPSNQQLMANFYGRTGSRNTSYLGDRLRPLEKALYERGVQVVKSVAGGLRNETVIAIPVEETEFAGMYYSADDLGVYSIVTNGKITEEAKNALKKKVYDNCDFVKVRTAICGDCPYETYWARNYYVYGSFNYSATWIDGEYKLGFTGSYHLDFWANTDFMGSTTTSVDPVRIANAATAVNNAKAIVAKYAGRDDVNKMRGYAEDIVNLNTYNQAAADGKQPNSGAWQLINVFDGDPNTNVVCAGYAVAFQYLCEISSFSQSIRVYSVTGDVYDRDGTGGAHQWNIVNIPGVGNRHVDVTWCDGEANGFNSMFFMAQPEDIQGGFRIPYSYGGYATYYYDDQTLALYTKDELTYTADTYTEPVITLQPRDTEVFENNWERLYASATGDNLTIKWQFKAPGAKTWTDVENSAVTALEVFGVSTYDGYQYRFAATDSKGVTVYSDVATLTVRRGACITEHPEDLTLYVGQEGNFTANGDGYGVTYKWQMRESGKTHWSDWFDIADATDTTLKVVGTADLDGCTFRFCVTDAGLGMAFSGKVFLTVLPHTITKQPENVMLVPGETASFSSGADGYRLTTFWQMKKPGGDWSDDTSCTDPVTTVVASRELDGLQVRFVAVDMDGTRIYSDAATMTVRSAANITVQPKDITVSTGEVAVFLSGADGEDLERMWQICMPGTEEWLDIECSASADLSVRGDADNNGSKYRYVVTDAYGNTMYSNEATLTVEDKLVFTRQPEGPVSVRLGETAEISVEVSGGKGIVYQWQYATDTENHPNETWRNCSSATLGYNTAVLKVVGTVSGNGYEYRCVVADVAGTKIISDAVVVNVTGIEPIITEPEDQNVPLGESAEFRFSVSGPAVGTDLRYQWQFLPVGSDTWRNCSSATAGYNTDCLKPVATAARNGYQYRCIATDGKGVSLTSKAAVLRVAAPAVDITGQPVSVQVAENETAVFTVTASGDGLKYQWQFTANGTDWRNCSSATAGYNTNTLKPVGTAARNGYQYRCVVTGASGTSVQSNAAVLNVKKGGPTVTVQPVTQTVGTNQTASFRVAATGTGLKYQWQYTANGTDWRNCSSATAGYNTNTLKPVGTTARNGYQYRCVITDANGGSVTTKAAVLVVSTYAEVTITRQPLSQTVALNQSAVFTVAASGNNVFYQWQYTANGTDWRNCSSATVGYNTDTLKPVATAARNGYQYRCKVTDAEYNTVISQAAKLTVGASGGVQITVQPVNTTVSVGQTASITVAAAGNGLTYKWQFLPTGSTGWRDCSSATAGCNTAVLRPVGSTGRNGYQYRCVITDASGASVTSMAVTLTVR